MCGTVWGILLRRISLGGARAVFSFEYKVCVPIFLGFTLWLYNNSVDKTPCPQFCLLPTYQGCRLQASVGENFHVRLLYGVGKLTAPQHYRRYCNTKEQYLQIICISVLYDIYEQRDLPIFVLRTDSLEDLYCTDISPFGRSSFLATDPTPTQVCTLTTNPHDTSSST